MIEQWLGMDWESASLIVLNLILIESLLSVDNAAVLATMVMDLPANQRPRALRYGIIGAYVFRGICLLFAYKLVKIWWLKPLGGLYLLWLAVDYFKKPLRYGDAGADIFKFLTITGFLYTVQADVPFTIIGIGFNLFWLVQAGLGIYAIYLLYSLFVLPADAADDGEMNKSNNRIYQFFQTQVGAFWSTVILVEIMDLAFSIDNVFAAVAFTDHLGLICIGVFIGILAMRFVAQWFVHLMEKYPFLANAAFLVIAILGLKLALSVIANLYPQSAYALLMETETADLGVSLLTMSCFGLPILSSILFNYPRRHASLASTESAEPSSETGPLDENTRR